MVAIIKEENLKEAETRAFIKNALRDGLIKTTGADLDKILPPVSRFGGDVDRSAKKTAVIEKLGAFFEKFYGVS